MHMILPKYRDAIQYSNSDDMGHSSSNYLFQGFVGMVVLRRNPIY